MFIPSHLYYIPFLWLFFVYGIFYKKHEPQLKPLSKTNYGRLVLIMMGLLFLIGGWIYPRKYTFYEMDNSVWENWIILFYRYILYFAATTFVLFCTLHFYKRFENSIIVKYLRWIGTHTITIYAGHLIVIYYITLPLNFKIMEGSLIAYYMVIPFVTLLVMFFLAVLEDLIFSKKTLRKLLLGLS